MKELNGPEPGVLKNVSVSFDKRTPIVETDTTPELSHLPGGAWAFPGVWSPHVGNGTGGPR